MTDYLTVSRRIALLQAGALFTTNAADSCQAEAAGTDRALLDACAIFDTWERQRIAPIGGPDRIDDSRERDKHMDAIEVEQRAPLDTLCTIRAQTLTGHQARARSFVLWDGGEVFWRAERCLSLEDRLLAAIIRDLTDP